MDTQTIKEPTWELRTEPEYVETDLRAESVKLQQQLRDEKKSFDIANYGTADIYGSIAAEVERAKRHGEKFASLHEAYAVLLEELDEVWDITRQKRRDRDALELRKELIQIAAMAVKALGSIEHFIGGSV